MRSSCWRRCSRSAAIVAIWANRQVLNTDNWTSTSTQLLENRTIRNQIAGYIVDQLYANVDVAGELRAALPERLQPLAGPAAGGLRQLADRAANGGSRGRAPRSAGPMPTETRRSSC